MPKPEFKARSESEWQGMRIDLSVAPTCASTEHCSRAQVCKSVPCAGDEPGHAGKCQHCVPCESDGECLRGEVCVLDHCIKRELAACRSAKDCAGVPCVLSFYSTGIRNNDDMRAYCPDVNSGTYPPEEQPKQLTDNRPPALDVQLRSQIARSYETDP
jgi:hypothetical protein